MKNKNTELENINTELEDFLEYKTLALKHSLLNSDLTDLLNNEENADPLRVKNVCARMPIDLIEKLDGTLKLLNMTKSKFINVAVISALDKASEIIHAKGIVPLLSDGDKK